MPQFRASCPELWPRRLIQAANLRDAKWRAILAVMRASEPDARDQEYEVTVSPDPPGQAELIGARPLKFRVAVAEVDQLVARVLERNSKSGVALALEALIASHGDVAAAGLLLAAMDP